MLDCLKLYKYCASAQCKSDYFITPRYTAEINMIYSEGVLILAGFSVSETLFTLGNMRYLFSVCRASDNLLHREQKAYVELDFKTLLILGHYLEWSLLQLRFKFTSL